MVVDSMRPHFVGVDPDILSTGLVFYYLKVNYCIYTGTLKDCMLTLNECYITHQHFGLGLRIR